MLNNPTATAGQRRYNPDVLSCLANLSSDEVFTPPQLANQMLDLLPDSLWHDPEARFLDPATKSGVFLREIARRLMAGLAGIIPDEQARRDHIFTKQVYGLAITELTALMTRRSLYCSKRANGRYSAAEAFRDEDGNIHYERVEHSWEKGRCVYCGASESEYRRDPSLETHAYSFIHMDNPEEVLGMKFDVIIGNPPYQLNVGVVKENYAIPLFHNFVDQAKKLSPRFLTMIIPSRWFTGGRGLDEFRSIMLSDKRLRAIVDYSNSRDCFPGVDVSGGVMYFLWDRDYLGECEYTNVHDGIRTTLQRDLQEFPVFPRYNEAIPIIRKANELREDNLASQVSAQTPFGLHSNFKGKKEHSQGSVAVISSSGIIYAQREEITRNPQWIDKYKVIFSKATSEHAGQADKDGKRKVLSSIRLLEPNQVCTQSYLVAGVFDEERSARNLITYLCTRFARFLLVQAVTSQDLSRDKFCFVPVQDFSEPWTDEELYEKYGLTEDEIAFIESMIRPMESGDE